MSKYSGYETFYAVATNDAGWSSAPTATDYTFYQPVIASVTAATELSGDAPMLTLTANGIDDGVGDVTSITFYRETGGRTSGGGNRRWDQRLERRGRSGDVERR